jgi:hypothetical protein
MNRRLAFSLRLLWVLALLASLGILFADYLGVLNEERAADSAAALSTLALAGTWLMNGLTVSAILVCLALACLLFWKKANEGMALYLSFFLLLWGIIWSGPLEFFAAYWLPQWPEIGGQLAGLLMPLPLLVLMLIFPNGQFAPRWTIWLLPLAVAPLGLLAINTLDAQSIINWLWALCFYAVGIQAYRYRRLYTPVERQQTKLVVYGLGLWIALFLLAAYLDNYLHNQPATASISWWLRFKDVLFDLSVNILPVAFTLAIMRYRLYDIDIIIRRTLVYSVLTLTLGLVYLGCILLTRVLVAPYIGGSELAIVASTLVIAALFNPLRQRIQNVIDKRFYRRKYDAAKVLAAFGATVRDETDLERLTSETLRVVDETLQPEFVGLWLPETPAHSIPEDARPNATQTQ